jgi:hypothetical protein
LAIVQFNKQDVFQDVFVDNGVLSNGQHAVLFVVPQNLPLFTDYAVDFCVSDTLADAVAWFKSISLHQESKLFNRSTGRAGLEGLRYALEGVLRLKTLLSPGDRIIISPSDGKRLRAYAWLQKYGFIRQGGHYLYRAPKEVKEA